MFQTAEESAAARIVHWLEKFPNEFYQLKVTLYDPSEALLGHREWKASRRDTLVTIVQQIVTYTHTFPAGTRATLEPQV